MELFSRSAVSPGNLMEINGRVPVPNSSTVAQYLPFLRRYARALTGNQTSGDAYVAASLEALIEDPAIVDNESDPRVALYRLFTKIWNSIPINESTPPAPLPGEEKLAN